MAWEKFEQVITVEAVGKFGLKTAGGWMKIGKFCKLELSDFKPGASYSVKGSVSPDKGAKFIDSAEPYGASVAAPSEEPATIATLDAQAHDVISPKSTAVFAKDEYKLKDNGIKVSGIMQAVAKSAALSMFAGDSADKYVEVVTDVTRKLVAAHKDITEEITQ